MSTLGQQRTCAFVIEKRGRTCRMLAYKGSVYCGEHLIHDQSSTRKRIVCPLDSSHSVFADVLDKHLKKCNVSKCKQPLAYSARINEGLSPLCDPIHPSLSTCSRPYLEDLVRRVETAYKKHVLNIKEGFLAHECMSDDLSDPTNGVSALKHLKQQASILSHLENHGMLATPVSCFVEFGAGRGKLTECIHRALRHKKTSPPDCDIVYILVDKTACRRKIDGTHRVNKLEGATCHRLRMDIMDLDLGQVEAVKGRGLVGVGKHLCGNATDFTLRCLINTLRSADDQGAKVTEVGPQLCGVAIALCCHHRCRWEQLVGREFMDKLGFTPADFHLISHMTSWAVCGTHPPSNDEDNGEGVDRRRWGYVPHPNEGVGLKCKGLIDLARFYYLQENGLESRLIRYVDRATSLENVLLLATSPKLRSFCD